MSERFSEPEPDPEQGADPSGDPPSPADRRSFLRQLSTDAVWTAGKVAGASAAFRRSLVAAGETALGAFDAVEAPVAPMSVAPTPEPAGSTSRPQPATAVPGHRPSPVPTAAVVAPTPTPTADPVAAMTPDQHAFLIHGPKAALAVNDPAGPPLLAFSIYHWDGSLFRLPARDFSARTIDIELDQRVGMLIEDPGSDAWVAITGIASLVYGEAVEPEMRLILSKYHDDDQMTARWDALRATGDQVVIRIRPTRFVWRSA